MTKKQKDDRDKKIGLILCELIQAKFGKDIIPFPNRIMMKKLLIRATELYEKLK